MSQAQRACVWGAIEWLHILGLNLAVIGGEGEHGNDVSAMYAVHELRNGKLGWLAEHIRRSDFRIDPLVARMILSLIAMDDPSVHLSLRMAKRSDLPPNSKDQRATDLRNWRMALQVGQLCEFRRGHILRACHQVGLQFNMQASTVRRLVAPHKKAVLEVMAEKRTQEAYQRGEVDFLGAPNLPQICPKSATKML